MNFQQEMQTVLEDVGTALVCVELTGIESGLQRSVPFTITSGTH